MASRILRAAAAPAGAGAAASVARTAARCGPRPSAGPRPLPLLPHPPLPLSLRALGPLLPSLEQRRTFFAKAPARQAVDEIDMPESKGTPGQPTFRGPIPEKDLVVNMVRSSGPGGQNVNKVSTKVEMRFNVGQVPWLADHTRKNLLEREKNRINQKGEIVITSSKTRSQAKNYDDALQRLTEIIVEASRLPNVASPETLAKIARLEERANQRRLEEKMRNKEKKSSRRGYDD